MFYMKFKTNMVIASQISFKTKSYLNITNNQLQYIKQNKSQLISDSNN